MRFDAGRSMVVPGALALATLLAAPGPAPARAAEPPSLKVLAGTPAQKGKWRVTLGKMGGAADASMAGHSMSLCLDAAQEMAKNLDRNGDSGRCTFKVVEDAAARGVFETVCDGVTTRTAIVREGPKSFLFSATTSGKDGVSFEGRYSYEGPCSADGPVVSADKDSAGCRQAQAQMAALDPAKACGTLSGTDRTSCEKRLKKARLDLAAVCR